MNAREILEIAPVIPVVTLDDAELAAPVARALHTGGIAVLELTLRTPAAPRAIERVAAEVPDVTVGAGTVTTPADARDAAAAGADFLVTPGSTARLLDAAEETALPVIPGAGSTSEAMWLTERGHYALKFFPARASGGVDFLRSVAAPLPGPRFCPTGGVGPDNAAEYLALPNVSCVGGSWLTPGESLATGDLDTVERLAHQASTLRG